jgi:MerR family transcriptional regulator, light-induced transcriptional regulator
MSAASLPQYVNTMQAAKALGVSVSTVKRWVDDGVLPAVKTAGGHRKVLLADVLELIRRGEMPQADLSFLTPRRKRSEAMPPHDLGADLYRALRAGDALRTRALIGGAYRDGMAIEELADRAIAPAMVQIGQEWERGRIDVMEEHRATQICAAALYDLKADLESAARSPRPRAIGGAPPNDASMLPTLMVEMTLLASGWEAINLGPNTPFESFAKAIAELKPRLLWISVCHLDDLEAFVAGYRELYRTADRSGVAVAIGGRALVESLRARIPYTTYGDGLSQLAAFARTLHPRPKPPRRGRPPKGA